MKINPCSVVSQSNNARSMPFNGWNIFSIGGWIMFMSFCVFLRNEKFVFFTKKIFSFDYQRKKRNLYRSSPLCQLQWSPVKNDDVWLKDQIFGIQRKKDTLFLPFSAKTNSRCCWLDKKVRTMMQRKQWKITARIFLMWLHKSVRSTTWEYGKKYFLCDAQGNFVVKVEDGKYCEIEDRGRDIECKRCEMIFVVFAKFQHNFSIFLAHL